MIFSGNFLISFDISSQSLFLTLMNDGFRVFSLSEKRSGKRKVNAVALEKCADFLRQFIY
jgi:hypothetical protein